MIIEPNRSLGERVVGGKALQDLYILHKTEWAFDKDLTGPDGVILPQTRTEVIAQQGNPVDQDLHLMLSRFGS